MQMIRINMDIRMTKKRAELLHHLRDAHGFLSASELHQALPHLDLATIYRNLELFVEKGLVRKYTFPNATEAVFEFQQTPHQHAICEQCNRVIHFEAQTEQLQEALDLDGFDISGVELVVRGHCRKHAT